jgi:hypothetical protein
MKPIAAIISLLLVAIRCEAASSINGSQPYAWAENLGWVNWSADGTDGAYIGPLFCYGSVYSANTGWVNLGNGTPLNGTSYSQSATDFGINIVNGVYLVGYAWGANIGWINFGINYPAQTSPPIMSMATGQLSGYAWSANCGWIDLDSTTGGISYGVVSLNTLSASVNPATTSVTLTGIPGATYRIQYAIEITGPWFNLTGNVVAPTNGIIQDSFPTNPSDPTLFFRAVLISAP